MAIPLPSEVQALLAQRSTTKVLTTLNEDGSPHAAVKQSLQVDEEGRLLYLELLETSVTHRNLTASLWFDRPLSILLMGRSSECWQLTARAERVEVSGPLFKKHYRLAACRYGDVDLAAVWILEPLSLRNQGRVARMEEEQRRHPWMMHLDRLVKPFKGHGGWKVG